MPQPHDPDPRPETSFTERVEGVDWTIAAETARILGEWVGFDPGLTVAQRQEVIDREAVRLHELTEQAAEGFAAQSHAQWEAAHPGRVPGHADTVATRETAWRAAREMVLATELYPRVTPRIRDDWAATLTELDAATHERMEAARLARDPERWKRGDVAAMPVATRIVERVWLEKPGAFLSLAEALITQRIEDDQPVPHTPASPLVSELEAMIEAELAANPPQDPDLPF